ENSYDDWCVAQMAKALHKDADYAYFLKRAHNYQNVYNPAIGFMAPRSMGGREKFVERLDEMFEEPFGEAKFRFLSQFPDATALTGNDPQGDEPGFHIPYLYNYAGEPWMTQRRVRETMKIWYSSG